LENERVRDILVTDPRIAFALLFGSAARGETTPFSTSISRLV